MKNQVLPIAKFKIGQEVYILTGERLSWYDFPFNESKDIKKMFDKEPVMKIIYSRLRHSNTRGCGIPQEDPIVISYEFNRYMYYDKFFLEKDVYSSLEEAVSKNKAHFESELKRYEAEQLKQKQEKKQRLLNELKNL